MCGISAVITKSSESKTYLFIHGAYHGAWCWDEVRTSLSKAGHETYALDLPGHGEDTTPRNQVTLDSYIQTVKNFILSNNLSKVILVAHSFGGVVISKVLDLVPERIEKIIFVTAMILNDGECFFDYLPKEIKMKYKERALLSKDNTIEPNKDVFKAVLANACPSQSIFENFFNKLNAQPISPYEQAVYLDKLKGGDTPSVYIQCSKDISLSKESFDKILSWLPKNANIVHLDADHEVFLSNPEGLAKILSVE